MTINLLICCCLWMYFEILCVRIEENIKEAGFITMIYFCSRKAIYLLLQHFTVSLCTASLCEISAASTAVRCELQKSFLWISISCRLMCTCSFSSWTELVSSKVALHWCLCRFKRDMAVALVAVDGLVFLNYQNIHVLNVKWYNPNVSVVQKHEYIQPSTPLHTITPTPPLIKKESKIKALNKHQKA